MTCVLSMLGFVIVLGVFIIGREIIKTIYLEDK